MSSNPYVVRTDSFFGLLRDSDWKPQEIAVENLDFDRECSRLIQELQTECLKITSTPNDQTTRAIILAEIQEVQNLQKSASSKSSRKEDLFKLRGPKIARDSENMLKKHQEGTLQNPLLARPALSKA
jgi:hypothetical protein